MRFLQSASSVARVATWKLSCEGSPLGREESRIWWFFVGSRVSVVFVGSRFINLIFEFSVVVLEVVRDFGQH